MGTNETDVRYNEREGTKEIDRLPPIEGALEDNDAPSKGRQWYANDVPAWFKGTYVREESDE